MSTPAIDLVYGLQRYQSLLTAIRLAELPHLEMTAYHEGIFQEIAHLSYDSITLKLYVQQKKDADLRSSLYVEVGFELSNGKATLVNVYCENTERQEAIKKWISENGPQGGYIWSTEPQENSLHSETLKYLDMADSIAKPGYLCSSGDNYRPGYFSEIVLENHKIILKQVNHWNAKSTDHRDDYHLRDLEFCIPIDDEPGKPAFPDYTIGKMLIDFSDRSSTVNKDCGDKIKETLLAEKLLFETPKKN